MPGTDNRNGVNSTVATRPASDSLTSRMWTGEIESGDRKRPSRFRSWSITPRSRLNGSDQFYASSNSVRPAATMAVPQMASRRMRSSGSSTMKYVRPRLRARVVFRTDAGQSTSLQETGAVAQPPALQDFA